jgi:peptidoglycan/LPS O-acetylase OafA/YrhL
VGTLRCLFALAVVFSHAGLGTWFVGARNAVQLFYISSGFLISYVLHHSAVYRDARVFYRSRALRLYPVYYAVALCALVLAGISGGPVAATFSALPDSGRALLAAVNAAIVGQDWVVFLESRNGVLGFTADFTQSSEPQLWRGLLVPQGWTLGIEIAFYALAPFVLPRRKLLVSLLAISAAARIAALVAGFGGRDPWSYRFFPFELSLFLAGALSQQVLLPKWDAVAARFNTRRTSTCGTALGLAACITYPFWPLGESPSIVLLFALFLLLLPLAFRFQQQHPWDKAVGDLSYPLYIGHMLVIQYIVPALGFAERSLVSVAGAVLFAALLDRLVAQPFEIIRHRLKTRATVQPELS